MIHLGIIIASISLVLIIILLIWWFSYKTSNTDITQIDLVHDIMSNDAYLQRLLMIEIISNTEGYSNSSEAITFNKMAYGISLLLAPLKRPFGTTVAEKIVNLMQKRNEIIRNCYHELRNNKCKDGTCVHIIDVNDDSSGEVLDITTGTLRKLELLTREITDNIASAFQIVENDKKPNYQRLFDLITMYNKELINQAKFYANKQYDISMNCIQSSVDIAHYISEEMNVLLQDSHLKMRVL